MDVTVLEQSSHKVLFVGLVWPEPTSTAAGQNILSYINLFIANGYQVTFACAADKSEHSAPLSSMGVKEQPITLNDSSFDSFVNQYAPDISVFDRFISEEQFGWRVSSAAPHCMKILDCEDLHFLRDARHQIYKETNKNNISSLTSEQSNAYLYSDLCKRELASILRCDLSILLSNYECQLLTKVFGIPKTLLHYCPFLIPEQAIKQAKTYEQRIDFISIGNFRHAPNWDAVLTLKQKIWPAIHHALPTAFCHVYGSYLTPKAKQLENKQQGFLVHGYAKDAQEVIGNARVLLAPLNFGAGIKGKLVDAMQCKTPSVTTEMGAEGLLPSLDNTDKLDDTYRLDDAIKPNEDNKSSEQNALWPGAINNIQSSTDSFIQSCIALYANESIWTVASNRSKPLYSSIFNYTLQSKQLTQCIQHISANLTKHRQQHFLGQVIQHHTINSAKYMSQWIEAKTRLKQTQC
ncbi:MAG: glycosyltransferase involved in cell wall biosynthesis [Glaciecola sp.]